MLLLSIGGGRGLDYYWTHTERRRRIIVGTTVHLLLMNQRSRADQNVVIIVVIITVGISGDYVIGHAHSSYQSYSAAHSSKYGIVIVLKWHL